MVEVTHECNNERQWPQHKKHEGKKENNTSPGTNDAAIVNMETHTLMTGT